MTEVEICNLALIHIRGNRISSLTEDTEEARVCSLIYANSRDSVLRAHPWGFAERREYLALLSNTPIGYDYAYQYPAGCLLAREIYNSVPGSEPISFRIEAQPSLQSIQICTDQESATLVYTAKVTLPNMFDPIFIDALSYKLAAELAMGIPGDAKLAGDMLQAYGEFFKQAKTADANEGTSDNMLDCEVLSVRS